MHTQTHSGDIHQWHYNMLTQAAVWYHNMCVIAVLLPAFLAPVLDAYGLVCLHNIGDLQLWVHLEKGERVLCVLAVSPYLFLILRFWFAVSTHLTTSWQYCRMPSLVPMQLLVPEGSDSHLPLCTLMCMLSLPQNIATWGSVSKPTESSAGTWKYKEKEKTMKG